MRKFIRKGFTLIEMAVVLVLLGILAALAVPTFSTLIAGTQDSTDEAAAEAIMNDIRGLGALENKTPLAFLDACSGSNAPSAGCSAADTAVVATSEGSATVRGTTPAVGTAFTITLPNSQVVLVTYTGGYPTAFAAQ